ncbi:MAG TPA: hypothetical protein VGH48_09925 [Caldimonas sp.]|jgi:hypothetical protein
MNIASPTPSANRYEKVIEVSKRVRWEIERDVIRGRSFDYDLNFLPAGLSLVDELSFLTPSQKRALSQVQGRTYANIFGLVERFIGAKMSEVAHGHALGDQTAFEAVVRFTDEELKHQALFRRIEEMLAGRMPDGYACAAEPNAVAAAVLSKSTWAVLGLTCHIELFTQAHYRASIGQDETLSPLWKDVFLFHWREESQHAILDEMEWQREDSRLSASERDAAVDDLIALVGAVDGILQAQASADAGYFIRHWGASLNAAQMQQLRDGVLKAYRWQYIASGVAEPRFQALLSALVTTTQMHSIQKALAPLAYAVPTVPSMSLPMAA